MLSDGAVDLSVVIPAHNAAEFIRETLISLDRQVVRPREVIVVDDGSTDETAAIASEFRFSDGSLAQVIRHEKRLGVAAARNHGVFIARGSWVGLCDSDDLWHRDRIKSVVAVASQHPGTLAIAADVSGFAVQSDREELELHQRGRMVSDWVADAAVLDLIDRVLPPGETEEVFLSDLQQDIMFATTSVCYRRDAYAIAGGCATWSDLSDDYMLNVSIAQLGPLLVIRTPHVYYRVRPRSLSHADANIVSGYLAANVAARYGTKDRDGRGAGRLYHHLLLAFARGGSVPWTTLLGFASLGNLGMREFAQLLKSQTKQRFRSPAQHNPRRQPTQLP